MHKNTIDLTGKNFGDLYVERFSHKKNKVLYWVCTCRCLNTAVVSGDNLKKGDTKSCGCLRRESSRSRQKIYRSRKRS